MKKYDLLIIGGGLTGMAAARWSVMKGLSTIVAFDSPGSLPHTSGAIDLLAVFPTETKRNRVMTWEALSELIEQFPQHPYGRVGLKSVMESVSNFTGYLEASSLEYYKKDEGNIHIITAAGTIKPTYSIPGSMKANAEALELRPPTLVLGFADLVDFSPKQVVDNLRDRWPGIRADMLDLREILDQNRRVSVSMLVDEFSRPSFRKELVRLIKPLVGKEKYLGLPAVLGAGKVMKVIRELEDRLMVKVFEIPLMSPSPPGHRLANMLKEDLVELGVEFIPGAPITKLEFEGKTFRSAVRKVRSRTQRIYAGHVILATGRFFGGGLVADRKKVQEPLAGLPVEAPACRDNWHMDTFLGAPGHPINRVGVCVDATMRPVSKDGMVIYENLFAAGAILSDHDWVREKSGAGISIATGYAAVESIFRHHEGATGSRDHE